MELFKIITSEFISMNEKSAELGMSVICQFIAAIEEVQAVHARELQIEALKFQTGAKPYNRKTQYER